LLIYVEKVKKSIDIFSKKRRN